MKMTAVLPKLTFDIEVKDNKAKDITMRLTLLWSLPAGSD